MRLAWFSPWPPEHSGVARRSHELTHLLAARGHAIDVLTAAPPTKAMRSDDDPPDPGALRVQSPHDFVWRHARRQYDLVVYQLGNSRLHDFIWPYLFRWPGLVVLHDARLHHARARLLLTSRRTEDYRAEFTANHPDISPDLAELAVAGYGGTYYYDWPATRIVLDSARCVATHSRGAQRILIDEGAGGAIEYVALGEGPRSFDVDTARTRFRAAHRIPEDAVVFGVFGALNPTKRVSEIIRAFVTVHSRQPGARFLLAGHADPLLDLRGQIASFNLQSAVHMIEHLDDKEFDAAIASADVSINLRWPTALETSGPWLRSLALRRATIVTDLDHQSHLPLLDPRTWHLHAPAAVLSDPPD